MFQEILGFVLFLAKVVVIGVPVIAISLFYFRIIRGVIVRPSTFVDLQQMGEPVYCAMQFFGHHIEQDGTIAPGPGPCSIGGSQWIYRIGNVVFYIWPIITITRISDYNDPDNFGSGVHVFLGDRTSDLVAVDAETASPENVPLTVSATSTKRVVNPRRYLYVAPRDVSKQITSREESVLRASVKGGNEERAQSAKGNGDALWTIITDPAGPDCLPIFEGTFRDRWGVEIIPKSIVIKDIGYKTEYQNALQAESREKLLANAKVAKISAVDKAMDNWVRAQSKQMKLSLKDTLVALKADGTWQRQRDIYMAQIMATTADLVLLGNPDGTPLSGNLGPIAALATLFGGRMSGGGGGGSGKGKRGKGKGKRGDDDDDDVEILTL